jgi:phosphoribosylformimino-5-aminoimidazole carboxamide ribotide isomerase
MTQPLIIFPAIDLKGGQVVRLAEGDMDRATIYGDDPAAQARLFAEAGATHLHVVDLDGAFAGRAVNAQAVERIVAAFPGKVQLGGGIRDRAAVDRWLALGVDRVVIGTAALDHPDFVREAAADMPGRIVVAVDARGGFVATKGWADVSEVLVTDLAHRFADAGVAALLFTDVGRDGLLKGCNVEATQALAHATPIPVIASGGVADIRDIEALLIARDGIAEGGIEGVITGRALYDGRLDLGDALRMAAG